MTITVNDLADQNKVILRIGQVIEKYEDLSPCAFRIRRNELYGIAIQNSASQIQALTLKFLIDQALLLPKTTLKQLKIDYEALTDKNVDKYFCDHPLHLKVEYSTFFST